MIRVIGLSSSLWEMGTEWKGHFGLTFLSSSSMVDDKYLLLKFAKNVNCEHRQGHIKKIKDEESTWDYTAMKTAGPDSSRAYALM